MRSALGRLTKKKDFDNAFKNGWSSFDKITGVKIITNNLSVARCGIIVSAKVSKLAVDRNRIKRQIREIVNEQRGKIKTGYDIVIITLPAIKESSFNEIRSSILRNIRIFGLH